jgi:hypothetical protein
MHLTKLVIQQESKKELEFCDASAGHLIIAKYLNGQPRKNVPAHESVLYSIRRR